MGAQAEPQGELVFAAEYYDTPNGVWTISDYTFTGTSNGSASWNMTINPYKAVGKSALLPISQYLNHKMRIEGEYKWNNKISGASIAVVVCGLSSTSWNATRKAYHDYATPGLEGKIKDTFVVTQSYFTINASQYDVNNYFAWRVYLNSNAGGSFTMTLKMYDLGVQS